MVTNPTNPTTVLLLETIVSVLLFSKNSNIRKRKHIRSSEKNLKTICMAPNHLSGRKESMQAYTYLR